MPAFQGSGSSTAGQLVTWPARDSQEELKMGAAAQLLQQPGGTRNISTLVTKSWSGLAPSPRGHVSGELLKAAQPAHHTCLGTPKQSSLQLPLPLPIPQLALLSREAAPHLGELHWPQAVAAAASTGCSPATGAAAAAVAAAVQAAAAPAEVLLLLHLAACCLAGLRLCLAGSACTRATHTPPHHHKQVR